ncbi:MAG: flavin reductase family protein [Ruminococcus sp.]|nr:flavin reductase family protein [Ruminococcus sp.]
MSKQFWKGSALLAPVPAALVTCGTIEKTNVLTIGWTGIVCTRPPMTYISVRPERYSHDIIKNSGEFVINLTTSAMCRETDFCGVKSGRDTDKLEKCGFHTVPAHEVSVPVIEECPVSLECRVTEAKPLGSHTMFLAEIVGIDVDEQYLDSSGRLDLRQCGLMAYAHGEYFALGKKLGDFGWSVRKKKKHKPKINPKNPR